VPFIENVGNLVCPSSYDLGEALRLVLLSVTEVEDKPLKYPTIFNTADVAIITKIDMTEAAGCDLVTLRENIERVRPGMPILEVSSKSGNGMGEWLAFVAARAGETSEHALS
jgi:hydrogenase nickel incorporation protein HypB